MKSCSSTGRLQHRDIIFSSLFFSLYLSFFFKLHRETRHRGSAPSTGEWDEDGETRWGGQKYIKARALYDYSWDWSGRRARRDVRFVEGRKKAKESGRKKERRKKTTSFTAQSAPCLQIAPGLFVVGRWYDCRMQRSYDGQTNSLSLLFVFFYRLALFHRVMVFFFFAFVSRTSFILRYRRVLRLYFQFSRIPPISPAVPRSSFVCHLLFFGSWWEWDWQGSSDRETHSNQYLRIWDALMTIPIEAMSFVDQHARSACDPLSVYSTMSFDGNSLENKSSKYRFTSWGGKCVIRILSNC